MNRINSVFIGGTPNAGKSTLAKKLSEKYGMKHLDLDQIREQMWEDPKLKYWTDFFLEKDEHKYWMETPFSEHWENIKKQSEVFWPVFQKVVEEEIKNGPVIFEAVNLLPHIMKDYKYDGVYLIAKSPQEVYERNKNRPRWGENEDLWKIESEMFYKEGEMNKRDADELGFKVFVNSELAEKELEKLINN